MDEIEHINNRAQLVELARRLGVRRDWHEPDEREVTAKVFGENFDNAGFWGSHEKDANYAGAYMPSHEMFVQIRVEGYPVAEVNLATLCAWACGYEDEER